MTPVKNHEPATQNPGGNLPLKGDVASYSRSDFQRDLKKVSKPSGKQPAAKK